MTESRTDSDERDRQLALALRYGLPAVTVLGALVALIVTSLGPAILVLATGGILGAIALLWTSLRSLFGDVPIDDSLDEAAALARTHRSSRAGERKLIALRALKDIEHEHAIGKIDDDDFASLQVRYRGEAKAALRELDEEIVEYRAQAEALVAKHRSAVVTKADKLAREAAAALATRVPCKKCKAKNDPDAAFCKKCGAAMKEAPVDVDDDDDDEDEDVEEREESAPKKKSVAAAKSVPADVDAEDDDADDDEDDDADDDADDDEKVSS